MKGRALTNHIVICNPWSKLCPSTCVGGLPYMATVAMRAAPLGLMTRTSGEPEQAGDTYTSIVCFVARKAKRGGHCLTQP